MGYLDVLIPGIVLVPQDEINSCWFASTMMMYNWQKSRGGQAPNPEADKRIQGAYRANKGLPWASMRMYAEIVGMKSKPLMSPTLDQLAAWLRVGPLWTDGIPVDWQGNAAGIGHVVVLAGLREIPNSNQAEVFVYDPWPVGRGHFGWRPISHLVAIMRAGADARREVTFLSY